MYPMIEVARFLRLRLLCSQSDCSLSPGFSSSETDSVFRPQKWIREERHGLSNKVGCRPKKVSEKVEVCLDEQGRRPRLWERHGKPSEG